MPLSQHEKMLRLARALEQKDEVFKEEEKTINEENISKEFERFKDILGKSFLRETAIPGQTVTSITNQSQAPFNPGTSNFKASSVGLQPNEALEIAIKRTLTSGTPVNDLDFYDEVNWNLNNLGFSSQTPVMIKEAVTALISK